MTNKIHKYTSHKYINTNLKNYKNLGKDKAYYYNNDENTI